MLFGFGQAPLADPAEAFVEQLTALFGPKAAEPAQVLVVDWGRQPFTAPTRLGLTSRYDLYGSCLLYTSDAADERSSVDLGGRRIIKKKKNPHNLIS